MLSKFLDLNELHRIKKRNSELLNTIDNLDNKLIEELFQKNHNLVFQKLNCLDCANCCRNYSPIIEQDDIPKLLKALGISFAELFANYLEMDADGDFVFKMKPCPMLNLENNECSIYENRPKACAEYPHTDMKNIKSHLDLVETNALICPAVDKILERIESQLI